jgi:oxygen-independent coproporphyrinogen-3 oxidase
MNTASKLLGLYIHLPFCVRKCRYCDFYSVAYDERLAERYLQSLQKEWEQLKTEYSFQDTRIGSIFFGGGTPSMLSESQWVQMLSWLRGKFTFAPEPEFTIECNPDSFSEVKAEIWVQYGINRLTVGIQSLDDRELHVMGRVHSANRAKEVLQNRMLDKFKSVGVDIIYGVPWQSNRTLRETLEWLLDCRYVKHLSAYELTINDKTPFGNHRKLLKIPAEDTSGEMVETVHKVCAAHGLVQYEVSNYACQGYRCRHNEMYWDHRPYIGLGCSAHSYLHPERWANVADIAKYIEMIDSEMLPRQFVETLDNTNLAREMIFLGLRRTDGLDEDEFRTKTDSVFLSSDRTLILERLLHEGLLCYSKPFWKPTRRGIFVADGIARMLM